MGEVDRPEIPVLEEAEEQAEAAEAALVRQSEAREAPEARAAQGAAAARHGVSATQMAGREAQVIQDNLEAVQELYFLWVRGIR